MDSWQKLEVCSKIIAAIMIPLVLAFFGNEVATANKQREGEAKFVELATNILSAQPFPDQGEDSRSLRRWAVSIIDKYSGVPMPKDTADYIVKEKALPILSLNSTDDYDASWAVIFGADASLNAAQFEIKNTAKRMGISGGDVFRRSGSFRSVKIFISRADAEDGLGKARVIRPDAYLVNMAKWCPTSRKLEGYYECGSF